MFVKKILYFCKKINQMKKFFNILLFCLATIISFAQYPFPIDNAVWNVKSQQDCCEGFPIQNNMIFTIEKDTIINDTAFSKFFCNGGNIGIIKQYNQKVWFNNRLLYDFGASVGDIICHDGMTINELGSYIPYGYEESYSIINSIQIINGKKYIQTNTNMGYGGTWIEGMGSDKGPFGHLPMIYCICLDGPKYSYTLGCFKINDTIQYLSCECYNCFSCPFRFPFQISLNDQTTYCYQTEPITASFDVYGPPYQNFPFTYLWTTNSKIYTFEDSTSANPTLKFLGDVTVKVKVKDNCGSIKYDSLKIKMLQPQLTFANNPEILKLDYYIDAGDSVFLNGNVAALDSNSTFLWSPCESIIGDCTVSDGFWVKPDTTTTYWLTATSNYCSESFFTYFYKVHVGEAGIKTNFSNQDISIFPNPTSGKLKVLLQARNQRNDETTIFENLKIFDITGRIVLSQKITNEAEQTIDISSLQSGIYYLQVNNEILKVIKE